jgi:hypothetical protein
MATFELTNFFAFCAIINYSVLLIWFLIFCVCGDWMHSIHSRWFNISKAQFELINYCGMGLFKLCIFVFNLAPFIALRVIELGNSI